MRTTSYLAFTALELLIVISVISILAVMLPVGAIQARRKLQSTACQNNLRQIGMGLSLYQQDNDERTLAVNEASRYLWFEPLRPYVKSNQIFRCPSIPEPANIRVGQPVSDYALNGFFTHSTSLDSFQNTSEQIAMSERLRKENGADYHTWESKNFFPMLNKTPHFKGANYLFADLHVKWYSWQQTLLPSIRDPTSGLEVGMHNRDALSRPTTGTIR